MPIYTKYTYLEAIIVTHTKTQTHIHVFIIATLINHSFQPFIDNITTLTFIHVLLLSFLELYSFNAHVGELILSILTNSLKELRLESITLF